MKILKTPIGDRSGAARDERYEFGRFRLDGGTRELWRGDRLVPLTPKAFDLLRVLVTSGGRAVEKHELMKLVWPDSFVGEDSLTQNVATLRKAHDVADEHEDVATASLIENWIDQTEKRIWFLFEASRSGTDGGH